MQGVGATTNSEIEPIRMRNPGGFLLSRFWEADYGLEPDYIKNESGGGVWQKTNEAPRM